MQNLFSGFFNDIYRYEQIKYVVKENKVLHCSYKNFLEIKLKILGKQNI